MMLRWSPSGQLTIGTAGPAIDRTVSRVLVEYDGPQLVLLTAGRRQFLAYAADEDGDLVRWIHAPVSEIEIKALNRGQITIRNAVAKNELTVVDVNRSGTAVRSWVVNLASLPDEYLPDSDALLPQFARPAATPTGRFAFECEGEAVRGHSITFACLAAVTGTVQKLWSAIAPEYLLDTEARDEWGSTTLACGATSGGSFVIEVEPRDVATFEAIAAQYKSLIRESYDAPQKIQAKLETFRPSLAQAYSAYLQALETYRIDVLLDVGLDATFIGFDCAARVRPHVVLARERSANVGDRTEIVSAIGYFDGFMKRKATFEFFDVVTGTGYKGAVSQKVLSLASSTDIVIGRRLPKYAVRLEVRYRRGKQKKCTLLAVNEA